jgi:hypothetical protein
MLLPENNCPGYGEGWLRAVAGRLNGHAASVRWEEKMRHKYGVLALLLVGGCANVNAATPTPDNLPIRISWGYGSSTSRRFYVKLAATDAALLASAPTPHGLESGEGIKEDAWQTLAGGGDVDGVAVMLRCPPGTGKTLHSLRLNLGWADLIAQSDPDTARRFSEDAAFAPGSPRLTVQLNPEGTAGFSVSLDQLLRNRAMWVPDLDVYITVGPEPVDFAGHQQELARWKGQRILDRVKAEPEATYQQFKALWDDLGSPAYRHPRAPEPGHIVCLTWDSAVEKFGIDRGGGVWNDLGFQIPPNAPPRTEGGSTPAMLAFRFEIGDLAKGIEQSWKSQSLENGLPIVTTVFEKDQVRYELEQFAYPLNGPPGERRGDMPMVLLQKMKLTNLEPRPRAISLSMGHRREYPPKIDLTIEIERQKGRAVFRDAQQQKAFFEIQGDYSDVHGYMVRDGPLVRKRVEATVLLDLPATGTRDLVVKLPSATVGLQDQQTLTALDYEAARRETVRFWSAHVARGAQFRVPEAVVNDLFRASLWHALRLPRRHGGEAPGVTTDFPYSNFAYGQSGTPWPVNQAVYVDYMLYDLRGYHRISAGESSVMFRNNQEPNGHVGGFRNWMVYTPGMLYAVAQNYLLSGDRALLEGMLPQALSAMDWCLAEIQTASARTGPSSGLANGQLNDGTGDGVWAFNQAYLYAGLDLFGQALKQIGHPRFEEALRAAATIRDAIARGFGDATRRSTLVQLRDHTWTPYVPVEALTPRRILEQWYPTDVDTSALHLVRLKALPSTGFLADALLNDHEDNLFLNGWGLANEPVYNQQATAYLLRDDPKAAIRSFYSYMAGAFSHTVLEPVEHRWSYGQYFGPPSVDGAWFELYRQMLIREVDDNALLLGQATPRKWLEDGKRIEVERAPTYYGELSATIESRVGTGTIVATIEMPKRSRPRTLLVRLRHPDARPMRGVTINGMESENFDVQKEWVRIENPSAARYEIVARY